MYERSAFTPELVTTKKRKSSKTTGNARVFAADSLSGNCANCGLIAWVLPADLHIQDLKKINEQIVHRHSVKEGNYLFRNGTPLSMLSVIKSGFLKISTSDESGRSQITGISMTGEIIGLDAFDTGKHQCEAIALEDSQLCRIGIRDFQKLTNEIPALLKHFHQAMGKEIARSIEIMRLLAGKCAEARIAAFLLNISNRRIAYGYSGREFRLPIKREEIGNHLSLKVETVSRVLSRFNDDELIETGRNRYRKDISLKDLVRLRKISES
jgi:CRP/FNR family transcriptional regulator, anaerobic regulatory protein